MLELVFWLQTHVFFGTLGSGVVQNDRIICGYRQLAALGYLRWEGWCMRGLGRRLGRGQIITAHITLVRHVYRALNQREDKQGMVFSNTW